MSKTSNSIDFAPENAKIKHFNDDWKYKGPSLDECARVSG